MRQWLTLAAFLCWFALMLPFWILGAAVGLIYVGLAGGFGWVRFQAANIARRNAR
jgi:hypothetical protein